MNISVTGSTFASDSLQANVAENEARWQVSRNADFTNLLTDTWYQSDDVTSFEYDTGTVNRVWVRVQYRDNYGVISEWSTALSIATATGGKRRSVVGASIIVPEPGQGYNRDNEAQFRSSVEKAIAQTQQLALAAGRQRGFQAIQTSETLADDAEIALALGGVQIAGQVRIATFGATAQESGLWFFSGNNGACAVEKLTGTTNTAATDSDTDLCVYTDGDDVYVKNRLGESQQCMISVEWI